MTTVTSPANASQQQQQQQQSAPANRRLWPIALGIATAAVVLVAGSYLLQRPTTIASPLPSPAAMLDNGFGKAPAPELLDYWSGRAAATPTDVAVLTQLGQAQLTFASETGELALYEAAEESFRKALVHNPSSGAAILGLANAVSAQHGFVEAQALLNDNAFKPSLNESVLTARGDAALELGDVAAADALYAQVAGLTPGEPAINSRIARVAYLSGDTERAVDLATDALRSVSTLDLRPADAAFYWFQLANYQWRGGNEELALANLDNALEIFPQHLGSLELYGRVLTSLDRYDDAIVAFEKLVVGGGAADLHGELEKLYTVTGQAEAAEAQRVLGVEAAAVQIDEFVAERRHLVDFYGTHDAVVALELAELDFADRQDIYSHDALAWALHLNGRSGEAAVHAEQAVALGTQEAKLHYHAGMIALANGDDELAKTRLSTALDIDERFDVIQAPIAAETLERLS